MIIVSAIGNEGPFQGTLNNPGDLINVIGVGSLDASEQKVAPYSSRGMTTGALLDGFGIVKPDIITYGTNIKVLSIEENSMCTSTSGTSISCSIISASTALALS